MVRQPTEYSKRQHAIQEAYPARTHLRKSREKLKAIAAVKQMDARNKWTEARKVMKKTEALRVSFGDQGRISPSQTQRSAPGIKIAATVLTL
jgi:hypothetical protein